MWAKIIFYRLIHRHNVANITCGQLLPVYELVDTYTQCDKYYKWKNTGQVLPFCGLIHRHSVTNITCGQMLSFCGLIHRYNVANIKCS